jgi:hypothetical protein
MNYPEISEYCGENGAKINPRVYRGYPKLNAIDAHEMKR